MNYDETHTNTFMQGFVEKISGNEFKYSQMMDFNKEKLMQYIKTSNFDSLHIDHGWKKRFFY